MESVIKSARAGMQVEGLFYQNDIESLHAVEKREQQFKAKDVFGAVRTLQAMIERETNLEEVSLYGSSEYVLAPAYKRWFSPAWHSWTKERRDNQIECFLKYAPQVEDSFRKP